MTCEAVHQNRSFWKNADRLAFGHAPLQPVLAIRSQARLLEQVPSREVVEDLFAKLAFQSIYEGILEQVGATNALISR